MKTIVPALLLMMTLNVYALVFNCQDGEQVETLVLEDHSAIINGIELINMMNMDWELPYRVYTRIGDPWFDLELDINIMSGKEGYASLRGHELHYGQTTMSKFYQCTPKI